MSTSDKVELMLRRCGYSQSLTCRAFGYRIELDASVSSMRGPRYMPRIWSKTGALVWMDGTARTKWDAVKVLTERLCGRPDGSVSVSSKVIASDIYSQELLAQRPWLCDDVLSTVARYDPKRQVIFHAARKWILASWGKDGKCSVSLDPHAAKHYGPESQEALRQYREWQGDETWKRERMAYLISSQVCDRAGEKPEIVTSVSVEQREKVK